jgi:hypothetical protein
MRLTDLTTRQQDIFVHRVTTMRDDLSDRDCQDLFDADAWQVALICGAIIDDIEWDTIRRAWGHDLTDSVLADAVDGGTYLAAYEADPDWSALRLAALTRSANALAKIVTRETGIEVEYPKY